MVDIKKNPPSYMWGTVLLFVPALLGLASLFGLVPHVWWAQVLFVLVIIGCVGVGSYLTWWGRRPRRTRNEWRPSSTLPEDDNR